MLALLGRHEEGSGGTNELALWVHHQEDRRSALESAEKTLRLLTDPWRPGFRKVAGGITTGKRRTS